LVRTVVERRQASAPASGGRRKPPYSVVRTARRLRAGMRQMRLPAFRFLFFFLFRSPDERSDIRVMIRR